MNTERDYTISRPTPTELAHLWEGVEAERARTHSFPSSMAEVVRDWGTGLLFFTGLVNGHLAALFGLANPAFSPAGPPVSAWVLLYVLPEWRAQAAIGLCRYAVAWCAQQGFQRLWTGIRVDNRAARAMARACGFTKCGTVPGLADPVTLDCAVAYYTWETPRG